jgi:rhamnogalacturonyl hydrolase YesR
VETNEKQAAEKALHKLQDYIEREEFKGYDPYDTLNSPLKFKWFCKLIPVLAIQFQKRNPINIRPLLGIKKEYNPKALGLLLYGYCRLQEKENKKENLEKIEFLFHYLKNNYSKGYSGHCWGYNFDWASSAKHIPAFSPNIVVTAFIAKGIFAYYRLTKSEEALEILESICKFVLNDLPVTNFPEGICFGYTTLEADCCYNASLLAALVLAQQYSITGKELYLEKAKQAVDFVVSKQHADGRWNYSLDKKTGKERVQIDFHQGYLLDCIFDVIRLCKIKEEKYNDAVRKGVEFYKREQFFDDGRSLWRLPKEYPVEIHNQSQGIITFTRLAGYDDSYFDFANTVATWTIKNMRDASGYFYYRKLKGYTNKISYMRWSQAWMFVALTELITSEPA